MTTRSTARFVIGVGCVIALGLVLRGQESGATLSGRVVDDRGAPVSQALVRVESSRGAVSTSSVADAMGRFALTRIPAGTFVISASTATDPVVFYGASENSDPPIELTLAADDIRDDIVVTLPAGGVVTGLVRAPNGEPIGGVDVAVFADTAASDAPVFTAVTDGTGHYRTFGIPRGTFLIGARPSRPLVVDVRDGMRVLGVPTLYPDAVELRAAGPVRVEAGVTSTADITLMTRDESIVSGVLRARGAIATKSYEIRAELEGPAPRWWLSATGKATVNGDGGEFRLEGLTPGAYRVVAKRLGSGQTLTDADAMAVEHLIARSGAAVSVDLPLHAGLSVRGIAKCIAVDGADARGREVRADVPGGTTLRRVTAGVSQDGGFNLSGLLPGMYRLSMAAASEWPIVRMTIGGRSTYPFEVVLDDADVSDVEIRCVSRSAALSGALVQPEGRTTDRTLLIAVPLDSAARTRPRAVRVVMPDRRGQWVMNDLAPGEYRVGAVRADGYLQGAQASIDAIASAGLTVTLSAGERRTLDLRAGVGPSAF